MVMELEISKTTMSEAKVSEVVVIGAGISGMSSAKVLMEAGVDVVVLEARERVGGRTYTKRGAVYQYCDVGGDYVGPSQNRILRLGHELGLETYKINTKGQYLHFSKGKACRCVGSWPRFWNPFIWCDIVNLFRHMDKMLTEIPVEAPWTSAHAEEWDHMTMKEWYDKYCWTQTAKEFGRTFVTANAAMEPDEISVLWFLWIVKTAGGTKRIWEVENGGQERKFVGGAMQVSERIAQRLGDGVKLQKPVKKITDRDGVVTIETLGGDIFKAKYVVVAIAPTLQLKLTFDPPLPSTRNQLIQRVPMGSCIKNTVFYKTAFWRENGLNGFISVLDALEPIINTIDDSKPDGSYPALTGFILGDAARRLTKMTREERQRLTCQCYARFFGNSEALKPVAYEENDWNVEEYSGGCFNSTYPTGVMTRFGSEIRKPIGRLFFAGTETATEWTGFMDGAVEAGERAAREALASLGQIDAADIWQSEPVFQGVPVLPFEETLWERVAPSVDSCVTFTKLTLVFGLSVFLVYRHKPLISGFLQRLDIHV